MKIKLSVFIFLIAFLFVNKIYSQSNTYYCYLTNKTCVSPTVFQFEIWLEWTGTNTQKFHSFQAGIDFNYTAAANGGIITGAIVPGSADPSLTFQQAPNWNINQTSKQIRLLALAAPSAASATVCPSSPGFRLGTFRMTNSVPFSQLTYPNFSWNYNPPTGTTTQTKVSFYLGTNTTGTDITATSSHLQPPPNVPFGCACTTCACPIAEPGGPYSSCDDVHLNGSFVFATTATWSSSGNGTFDPNNTTMNPIYHPSVSDFGNGSVNITLTTDNPNGPQNGGLCNPASSTVTVILTSVDDSNPCTIDACNSANGTALHNQICPVTLHLRTFLEGFYLNTDSMKAVVNPIDYPLLCDTLIIELHNPMAPYSLVTSVQSTISTDGRGDFVFPVLTEVHSYFIVLKHRNSVPVWSKSPVLFNESNVNFDFTRQ